MKKIFAILLSFLLLLTLCACAGKAKAEIPEEPAVTVEPTVSPASTDDPNTVHVQRTPEPERTPAPEDKPQSTPAPTASPTVAEPVGSPVVTTPEPTAAPAPPAVPEVSISSGSAVYSIVDQAGSYTDSLGNTYTYQYKVPAFGCTGPDTELLSEELYNAVMPTVNAELAAMQNGSSLSVTRTDYVSYSNGRYISVVCTLYYADGGCAYKAVSLNANTGFRASASELMQYVGVSEADFAALASQAAGSKFTELYGQPSDDASTQAYNSTVNTANFSGAEVFINSSGRLAFPAKIYSAGGAYCQYILSI